MKLKWIIAENLDKNIKATAHKTGKLGFTREAADKLNLSLVECAQIAINEDDPNDDSLYVAFWTDSQDGAFRVSKAGDYYYLNTKHLFDTLKIDYQNENVVYDIIKDSSENDIGEIYKFKRRLIRKKAASKKEAESMS